jgi:hypothetical protein
VQSNFFTITVGHSNCTVCIVFEQCSGFTIEVGEMKGKERPHTPPHHLYDVATKSADNFQHDYRTTNAPIPHGSPTTTSLHKRDSLATRTIPIPHRTVTSINQHCTQPSRQPPIPIRTIPKSPTLDPISAQNSRPPPSRTRIHPLRSLKRRRATDQPIHQRQIRPHS